MAANKEVLENLERVLDAIPENRFEMAFWSDYNSCGTSHCLAGWARLDPWMQENTDISEHFNIEDLPDGMIEVWPAETGEEAVEHLADILRVSYQDAGALFAWTCALHIENRVTKQMVRDNIHRLMLGEPAIDYGNTLRQEAATV